MYVYVNDNNHSDRNIHLISVEIAIYRRFAQHGHGAFSEISFSIFNLKL